MKGGLGPRARIVPSFSPTLKSGKLARAQVAKGATETPFDLWRGGGLGCSPARAVFGAASLRGCTERGKGGA
jgi:hypothetical protein